MYVTNKMPMQIAGAATRMLIMHSYQRLTVDNFTCRDVSGCRSRQSEFGNILIPCNQGIARSLVELLPVDDWICR
jgi:hypothetical protein